jgi:glycine cleavage system transcriptional repressor
MESSVAGTEAKPIYIMQIEGHAAEGIDALQSALDIVTQDGIEVQLESIETLIG